MIPKGKLVACDTETTGLDVWHGDRPFAISWCNEEFETGYVRWVVDPLTRKPVLGDVARLVGLQRWFADESITKVFHNAKFDIRMLESIGVVVRGPIHETVFAMHVLNNLEPTLKLKVLADKYLDMPPDDEIALKKNVAAKRRGLRDDDGYTLAETGGTQCDYWLADDAILETYAVGDVERTMGLWLFARDLLGEEDGWDAYNREIALHDVTYAMETRGVRVSVGIIQRAITDNQRKARKCAQWLHHNGPKKINLNSSKQLYEWLYSVKITGRKADGKAIVKRQRGGLHLPVKYWTGEKSVSGGGVGYGQPSVEMRILKQLKHPYCEMLVKLHAAERESKFFEGYEKFRVRDDNGWCIHPEFRQLGTVTARYSCAKPNLTNVPDGFNTRSIVSMQARTPFGPRHGYVWYLIDYTQMEVRIFADVANEKFMLSALARGRDIHTECCNRVWGGEGNPNAIVAALHALEFDNDTVLPESAVVAARKEYQDNKARKNHRRTARRFLAAYDWNIVRAEEAIGKKTSRAKAKGLTFLKTFGGGANRAKDELEVPLAEAVRFLGEYDAAFPRIVEYINEETQRARNEGCIRTTYNRKLRVPRDKAYRAVNYKVQGSAADHLKDRMIAANAFLRQKGIDGYIVLTIYDEVVFEIKREEAYPWVLRTLKRIMEDHGGRFGVPLPVDIERADKSWTKKVKVMV